jgi:predicted phosphoribosyltransferase
METGPFRDRSDAGRRLAVPVERVRREAPVIVALPRGGVPIALEIAAALAAPLDLLAVREIGPPERRFGAVAEGGIAIVDHDTARGLGLTADALSALRESAAAAAAGAGRRLRGGRAPVDLVGRTVVIVEDGSPSAAAVIAAARTARHRGAARIVLAAPIVADAALARFAEDLDEVIRLDVGPLDCPYQDRRLPSDGEIGSALRRGDRSSWSELHVPEAARGVLLLATSDSFLRGTLDAMGFATLPLPRADAEALVAAAHRARRWAPTAHVPLGILGLGPTAPAALTAATVAEAGAVVAAGGRPDEVADAAAALAAPTLLIVGGEDQQAVRRAREACAPPGRLAVVAGASRAFAEPGALEQVAHLAGGWFARHLAAGARDVTYGNDAPA